MSYEWTARIRDYQMEKNRFLRKDEVVDHPLKISTITVQESKIKKRTGGGSSASSTSSSQAGTPKKVTMPGRSADPLSASHPLSTALEGMDPLSQFVAMDPLSQIVEEHERTKEKAITKKSRIDDSFEPWTAKKSAILNKYTTSEKLSIATSFLSGGEKVVVKTQSSFSDKVKTRLEQLDDFEEGSVKEMLNLTQQEYVNRIEELNQALRESWEHDQRVKALKIGIQCAKLLVDTSVIQFYPSKFVLITDILDNFGHLVYQRIHSKAQHYKPGSRNPIPLPEVFTPGQVPELAKETCRNWFFKIASIRELIPRFYMETAILKSYSFLQPGDYSKSLIRLTKMIRGIGDPLVAAYARCYLCRVGMSVAPEAHEHLRDNFWDFLTTYNQLQCVFVKLTLTKQNVDIPTYLTLYPPALDWILQCVAYKASDSILSDVLQICRNQCNSALLLNSIMAAFKPEFVAKRSLEMVDVMKECDDSGFPKHLLFRTLGLCLVVADPPEKERLQILNDVWKIVTKLKAPLDYMNCAEIWIEYPAKHFGKREVNTFLGDIIKHVTADRAFESLYPQLTRVIDRVLAHLHDFSIIFAMEKFLPFLDLLQKESIKVDVCKTIMEAFVRYQTECTCDPVIINAAMFICKILHDSVNALTFEDETRQIGYLLCDFVRKISFGRDFEQQLSFYVESRATFSNLDSVLVQLVQCVNMLSMRTRQIVKGHHTRKTSAFVKACAAYSFITIPSLMDVFDRLQLYLISGQVALLNQCLSQADAFFKTAISLIPETPPTIELDFKNRSSEPYLVAYINNLLTTLLIVPDHPEQEPLYLVRGLLNVVQDYAWDSNTDSKILVFLNVLNLLSAAAQETYIWHLEGVDSNDALYGNDPKFIAEVNKISSTIIDEILAHLKSLGEKSSLRVLWKMTSLPNSCKVTFEVSRSPTVSECEIQAFKRQSHLALELFSRLASHGDLSNNSLATLAHNLWLLAHRHGNFDPKFSARCLEHLKKKALKLGKPYNDLASKIQLPSQV